VNAPDANAPLSSASGEPGPAASGGRRWVTVRPPQVRPTVTYTLIGLTVAVYLLQMASVYLFGGMDYPAALGMKANQEILLGQLWRLITPMFLHSNSSLLHIGFNMYALYALGPQLERFYGHWRFLLLYLLGGFAGNVASFLLSPEYSLGASTAIFGLIGAEGIFLYRHRQMFGGMAQRALVNIVIVAAVNLIIGLSPGIDNWGHVGGLLGGTLFAWFGGPLMQVEADIGSSLGSPGGSLKMSDRREPGAVLAAGLLVGLLFAALAAVKFFLT
jgi:rhomboid protease GluP